MEYFQARVDSYSRDKAKRSKASSSKSAQSAKWPHPASFKATPKNLAEAGFYFNPDSESPDNVTCFMCRKSLAGWEEDDDPFAIHYDKCRNTCSWATVRCQRSIGEKNFDFSDPTRHPTSSNMEKARLDTFTKLHWPHSEEHGANAKALAKAGFICNALEPDDDTVLCLYCNIALGGWDPDDDPLEEHRKRDKKTNKGSCPFLKAYAGNPLSKSTAKRPTSKTAAKPPSRTASQTLRSKAAKEVLAVSDDDSDDELAAAPSDSQSAKPSTGRKSKASTARASSVAAKTPASRRTTRGTSTSGKTPGNRTVSSEVEVEETDGASESETGKRATKAKRKTGGRAKSRVSAIAEEDNEAEQRGVDEDVEMGGPDTEQGHDAEPEAEPEPAKKKRARAPKSAVGKPSKGKKAQVKEEEEEADDNEDPDEVAPPPVVKKGHGRTRSKANLQSDSEAPSTSAKPTHTRTKSTSKAKTKQEVEDPQESDVAPAPAPKKKGKRARKEEEVVDEEVVSAPPQKPKAKAVSRSKSTLLASDEVEPETEQQQSRSRVQSGRSAASRPDQATGERNSSLSEDAGYATAEPMPEGAMDVDDEPAAPPIPVVQQAPAASKSVPPPRPPRDPKRPSPALSVVQSSSRASSARPSSRPASKVPRESPKIVEIDSDGEATGVHGVPAPAPSKGQAAPTRTSSNESTNAARKPASHASKKKLQVEVVISSRPPPRIDPTPEDVPMEDHTSPSPVRPNHTRVVTPPGPETPMSAIHRSAPPSPARDVNADQAVPMPDPEVAIPGATTNLPRVYHPYLAQVSFEEVSALTEEEANMSLEQYIRREMELQYVQMKADAERRIEQFKQKAAETRRVIETS